MQTRRSRSGRVFTVDGENRLKVYDEGWKEVASLNPRGLQRPGQASPGFAPGDQEVMLWPMGGACLGIVDMEKMEIQVVERLGGLGLDDWAACGGVSAGAGGRVVCLCEKKEGTASFLAYWQNTLKYKTVTRKATYIHPDCIEVCKSSREDKLIGLHRGRLCPVRIRRPIQPVLPSPGGHLLRRLL
jgi:hypothetical protein